MTATRVRALGTTGLLTVLTSLGLLTFTPAIGQLRSNLVRPHTWVSQVGPDAALASFAGAMLWLASLWLLIGLLAALFSGLPGRPGRLATAFAGRALPAAMRKLVLASTGASLLITPTAAFATGPVVGDPPPTAVATPFWPLDQPSQSLPAPQWPASTPSAPQTGGAHSNAGSPTLSASPPTPPHSRPPTASPTRPVPPPAKTPDETITVQPGDSLWTIASQQLGSAAQPSQVAVEWPHWYRANRKAIGRNPNLIRPGSELTVPEHVLDSTR